MKRLNRVQFKVIIRKDLREMVRAYGKENCMTLSDVINFFMRLALDEEFRKKWERFGKNVEGVHSLIEGQAGGRGRARASARA